MELGPGRIRAVTHYGITPDDVVHATAAVARAIDRSLTARAASAPTASAPAASSPASHNEKEPSPWRHPADC